MTNSNSFDRMVSGLSSDERQSILDRMKEAAPAYDGEDLSPVDEILDDDSVPLIEQLKHEPLFLRLMLWLKSIFTNSRQEILYNEIKISNLSKKIEHDFPGLIDWRRGILLSAFRQKLLEIKECADFFRPYIAALEQDEGNFYVALGNMVMPVVASSMSTEVDPYSGDLSAEAKPEFRMSLLHQMDEIFQNIPKDDRAKMYEAVKTVEWLRQFVKLPFNRFCGLFSSVTDDIYTCNFSQLESEVGLFARVLSSGFRISDEVLKCLYLFSIKNSYKAKSQKLDESAPEAIEYVNKARSNIALLHMFMNSVPMKSIGCIVYDDCHWRPETFAGGEDWFVKFKACWKKIFEQKWDAWCQECKKEGLRLSLSGNFNLTAFPLLPYRPWTSLWGGVYFRYELTGGFLYWFFREKFPSYEIALKTVLVEGNFAKKENQISYTDIFNDLVQNSISMTQVVNRLSPDGDVGVIFSKLADEHLRTLQGQTKIEQLMRSVESDIQSVIHKFCDACRMMDNLLSGILGLKKDVRYDALTNLAHLNGEKNEEFLKTLSDARLCFINSLNLIKELETVDSPTLMDIRDE